MTILDGFFELGNAHRASNATDKRTQWGAFGILTVLVVVASTLTLTWAASLRQADIGLSAAWRPTITQKRIDDVIAEVLGKQRLASWFAVHGVLSDVKPAKPENPYNRWSALGTIAETVTSEVSRKSLAARLARRLRSNNGELNEVLRRFRLGTLDDKSLTAAIDNASEGTAAELWLWLDEVLPNAAVLQIVTDAGGALPADTSARDAVWLQIDKYFWSEQPAGLLVDNFRRQFETEALDDAVVQAAAKDFTARLVWTVAGVLFTTAALIAIFGALARVRGLADPTAATTPWLFTAAVVFLAGWGAWTSLPDIGTPFLSNAVDHFNELYNLHLDEASRIFNALAAAAIVALITASWASFLNKARDERHLRLQLDSLRWSLNVGSALLVAGVIEVFALSQWPAAFASDSAGQAITTAATAAAGALGVTFSLILLLIYLPGSQILRERMTDMIAEKERQSNDGTKPEAEKQRARNEKAVLERAFTASGLEGSFFSQLTRFAQALLPLLVSATLNPLFALLG